MRTWLFRLSSFSSPAQNVKFTVNPSVTSNLRFIITWLAHATELSNVANSVFIYIVFIYLLHNKVGAEWMQTYSIQMLHLIPAVEAQLVACSAVIKEIKIQTSFTKTHSSGLSTKINTQPHQSLQCSPKSWFTHLNSLLCFDMEKCWKWNSGVNTFIYLHHSDAVELLHSKCAPYLKPHHAWIVPLLVKPLWVPDAIMRGVI